MVDSRNVKAAETVSKATRGYDAGKKINGRTRHVVVDTRGLPLSRTAAAARSYRQPDPQAATGRTTPHKVDQSRFS